MSSFNLWNITKNINILSKKSVCLGLIKQEFKIQCSSLKPAFIIKLQRRTDRVFPIFLHVLVTKVFTTYLKAQGEILTENLDSFSQTQAFF